MGDLPPLLDRAFGEHGEILLIHPDLGGVGGFAHNPLIPPGITRWRHVMATQMRQPPETRAPFRRAAPRGRFRLERPEAGLTVLLGAVAIILGIIGLFGELPTIFASISALVLGLGLALEAGLYVLAINRAGSLPPQASPRSSGGFTSELIFGLLGVLLAVLALANLGFSLAALSVISSGIGLWSGSAAEGTLLGSPLEVERPAPAATPQGPLVSILLCFGAIILGIIALFAVIPVTLTLIGTLLLGCGLIASGQVAARRASGQHAGP